jgi:ketosteroid isomerase-like protein
MVNTPLPDDLREMLDRTVAAENRLVAGDAEPYLALWSGEADVTVLGAMGAHYRGPEQVRQSTDLVALNLRGGRNLKIEPLAIGASGDLAYAVWIERTQAQVVGRDEYAPLVLRVTHIFRREKGAWKLVHRHADPLIKHAQTLPVQEPRGN